MSQWIQDAAREICDELDRLAECQDHVAAIIERHHERRIASVPALQVGGLLDQAAAEQDRLKAEIRRLEMLLACKNEALGVFADHCMWVCRDRKGEDWLWQGADAYANPMAFARREMERDEPNDSIGSVTHTME